MDPKSITHKPKWLLTKIPSGQNYFAVKEDLRKRNLVTVCEEAKCPNIGECWGRKTATFMVLGDTCTRACKFCHVKTGNPQGLLNHKEPESVAESCKVMGLDYVVITMVDRDDLPDGGADHVGRVISQVKEKNPGITIELLAGDFHNEESSLRTLLAPGFNVFAHNLETVERLTPRVRDARATYRKSLAVLERIKGLAPYKIYTKSALMLGLGETVDEILQTLQDLRKIDVDFITIGQYVRPSKKHLSVKEWVAPENFQLFEKAAKEMGFLGVASAPLVRSSYRAREFYHQAVKELGEPAAQFPL